jgi:hypothetical protein
MSSQSLGQTLAAAFVFALQIGAAHCAPFMIVGNDEKILWDDNGKPVLSPPGKDSVVIVDVADALNPKIVATLPIKNSVVGPPVNVAIDPSESIALIADSIDVIKEGDALKQVPDDKIHVVDLKANPTKVVGTVTGAKQPSGLSISPSGNLALVANRADKSISVLSIKGTDVKVIDTIPMGTRFRTLPSPRTASARSQPSSRLTRWRCSTSQATRSPTPSSIFRPGCGPTMSPSCPPARLP